MINQQIILLLFLLFTNFHAQYLYTFEQQPLHINHISGDPIILQNQYMTLKFDSAENGFGLLEIKINSDNYNFLTTPNPEYPTSTLWKIEFVTREGLQYVNKYRNQIIIILVD